MKILAEAILKCLNRRLIDSQIEVYLAWVRKNQRWDVGSDKEWLELFAEVTDLQDILDVTRDSMDVFEDYIVKRYGHGYMESVSQKSVIRFVRFYSARTKSFTNKPRYVVVSKDTKLSTVKSSILLGKE